MERSAFLALVAALPLTAPRARAAVRIVALGDSLALATGASRDDGGFIFPAYRVLLRARPGSMLDNVAIGGSTAADVLRLQTGRIAGIAPDVVVVCVGGNDVVRRTARDAFARTYAALLSAVREAAPRARIVCCGVPDVGLSPIFAGERAAIASLSAADDAAVRRAVAAAGAHFVDFYALTRRERPRADRFLSRDRFHPSDAGYALLSAAFLPSLLAAAST